MIDVVLGLQWGDEGKGKIADFLTPHYDIIARFQGGPNAGHSLEMNGKKHVLNTIPSGVFHPNCMNVIGNGVVIDPVRLKGEITRTEEAGANLKKQLLISKKANLILPTHSLLDKAKEAARGNSKIGSTLRGIGPTYRDKIGRSGIRVGDITSSNFKEKYIAIRDYHLKQIAFTADIEFDMEALDKEFYDAIEFLKGYQWINTEYYINKALAEGKRILAEGAQGSMLDVDFGSYPYVTSSNTIAGGACNGLGISPKSINKIRGIFKAYCTRVGSGPFPSELNNEVGQRLRDAGHEYGATTGRPRRTGWLDLVALKYAVMLSGVNELIMMKSDILSGFDEIKVATKYKVNGKLSTEIPFDICDAEIEPIYETYPGWDEDISAMSETKELPKNFADYVSSLEQELDVPIKILSVGPDRSQTIANGAFQV
jgi:adenylosuccinate synthase